MQPENIIIRRRRKRWPPSEPRLDESYMAPPDTIPPNLTVFEFPPSSDGFTERGLLTLEKLEQTGEPEEKNPALSEACSSPVPAPQDTGSHEGQTITVHQFLHDMTKKPCRKYGRRNRFAVAELGIYRSEGSSPSPISCSDDDQSDRDVSTPHRAHHVQSRHPSRRMPKRQQKVFAKPLARRLFEADVFSTGAFSRPTAQDSAHTSTRRPLQFITSLNLTPSLENRIYQRRQIVAGGSSSTRTDSPGVTVARGRAPNRNTLDTRGARIGGGSGALLAAGKRVLRARGREQGLARSSAGPFEFVPLPLVRVKTHRGAVQPHSSPSAYTKRQSEFNSRPTTRPLEL
ncbi:hypothetical protein BJY52DRAFT_1304332 [Lactarius psammicola]|nr:hypothetical protein BJY52DRAFT_1304178 [Lactarius psammicola]KAI9450167.1 hypothetical protein BJY52DRAFT_1304332 [Lactarius psammicola]